MLNVSDRCAQHKLIRMRDILFACNRNHQLLIFRTGKPIRGRQIDVPHIPSDFELDPHMIERAISLRTPHPNNACWNHSRRPPGILMAYLEHDGRTRRRIADTLILAAVAIHHYGFGGFTEWLAKRVSSFDGDRGGMHHPRAATLLARHPRSSRDSPSRPPSASGRNLFRRYPARQARSMERRYK